jgi:hypothetical protein
MAVIRRAGATGTGILAWLTVFYSTVLLFMENSRRTQSTYDPAAHQAEALANVRRNLRIADKIYRRFRLALMTTKSEHAVRVIEWIPISDN